MLGVTAWVPWMLTACCCCCCVEVLGHHHHQLAPNHLRPGQREGASLGSTLSRGRCAMMMTETGYGMHALMQYVHTSAG